jgi:hypothetical protein
MGGRLNFARSAQGVRRAEVVGQRALGANFFLDLFAVIVVIRECGVNVRESDGRNVRDDFVRRPSILLVPDHHVEHTNSMAGNARPPQTPGVFVMRSVTAAMITR